MTRPYSIAFKQKMINRLTGRVAVVPHPGRQVLQSIFKTAERHYLDMSHRQHVPQNVAPNCDRHGVASARTRTSGCRQRG